MLGQARPNVDHDGSFRGHSGARGAGANPPLFGRHVSRVYVGIPDGHGRGRRPDSRMGLDLEPAPPLGGWQGQPPVRAGAPATGPTPGRGTPSLPYRSGDLPQ